MKLRTVAIDIATAAAVALVVTMSISVATEPDSRPADLGAYALGALIGALQLARTRWPLATLLATATTLLAYYSLLYPAIPPALALAVALYTATRNGHLRWSLAVTAFFLTAGLVVRGIHKPEPIFLLLTNTVLHGGLMVAAILLGEVIRSRQNKIIEERLRIARELHDVMGHTIAAITVQAAVAAEADDPSEAIATIRSCCRDATTAVKAAVTVLREPSDLAKALGLRIEHTVTGDQKPLPPEAYRIIQEALTNVRKHAGTDVVRIDTAYEPTQLTIEINSGLKGMRERAAALGGTLEYGPVADGFRVRARLPLQ